MPRVALFGTTVTCDEHEDAIIIYRACLAICPMCQVEKRIEDALQSINDVQADLARQRAILSEDEDAEAGRRAESKRGE